MIKSRAGSEIDNAEEVLEIKIKQLKRKQIVIEDLGSIIANSKIQSRA